MLDVYSILSLVTPNVEMRFYMIHDVFLKPFSISIPIGNSVVAKMVYTRCLFYLSLGVSLVDFIEIDML